MKRQDFIVESFELKPNLEDWKIGIEKFGGTGFKNQRRNQKDNEKFNQVEMQKIKEKFPLLIKFTCIQIHIHTHAQNIHTFTHKNIIACIIVSL